MSERPRVLFLTSELPYPPHQGMAIRAYNLIAGLRERFRVNLYSLSSSPEAAEHAAALRQVCERVEVLPAPTRTRAQRVRALLTTRLPDMALRAYSPAFQGAVLRALAQGEYAILHVESIEMAPYALAAIEAGLPRRPRIVFDDLNAEYLLQKRAFETDLRHPRRWIGAAYSFVQWRRLARYERQVCRLSDCVVAVSEWDRDALARLAPGADIRVVPNGIDAGHYVNYSPGGEDPTASTPGPKLVFTGKMDFRPNVDAVCWFADAILPRIQAHVPDVHLYIVGQRPSPAVQALGSRPGITVTGFVPDVRPYIAAADVYVVPMRMGGGTRLKVLEAMTLGKAIVSTSLGCEGYGLTPGRELVVADDAARFADETGALLRDPARRAQLGALAREFAVARYDWSRIVPLLEQAYGF
ncbi:MAG: glycosyltransferase [Anaerolineae bacterium]|nr:glycosyltransferase [Anaerolineae bacterium]